MAEARLPSVLVVEDDAPVRRMLERTLVAEGYAVAAVADGGSALARTEAAVPDAIVLDVAMAGIDGLAVARRLRSKGVATPILMLTARDGVDDRVAGLDAGADDYLVKPFATAELPARIRALLRRTQPADVRTYADLVFDPGQRIVERRGRTVQLTAHVVACGPPVGPDGRKRGAAREDMPRAAHEQLEVRGAGYVLRR
jgi:two-component system response regulator MprA